MTLESRNRKNKKHNPHGPRGERCSPTPTRFNQPDPSTRLDLTPPPLSPWPSALPLPPLLPYHPLHPSVHNTAASLPPAPYRAPPSVPPLHQHNMTLPPISSPVRSHSVPHVNQGRASRPEVDERAARFTRLMRATSAAVQHISFLARRCQPDCKTNCFSIAGFDCIFLFDWFVQLIVFFYCRPLIVEHYPCRVLFSFLLGFGFTKTYWVCFYLSRFVWF